MTRGKPDKELERLFQDQDWLLPPEEEYELDTKGNPVKNSQGKLLTRRAAPMSPSEKRYLIELLETLEDREREALNIFEPYSDVQREFIFSDCHQVVLRGGNRSGKTMSAAIRMALWALWDGRMPMCQSELPESRRLAWMFGYDESHVGRVFHRVLLQPGLFWIIKDEDTGKWRSFKPWLESDRKRENEKKPSAPLIPPRLVKDIKWSNKATRAFSRIDLVDELNVEFWGFSSRGECPAGVPIDWAWVDEDLHYESHVGEIKLRLVDKYGYFQWSAFPLSRNQAMVTMSEQAEAEVESERPLCKEFQLTLSSNPHLAYEAKQQALTGLSEEERRARDEGSYNFDSIRMYPEFRPDVHGMSLNQFPDNHVPNDWTRYAIFDPGITPASVLFGAVPPPDEENPLFQDILLVYDELQVRDANAPKVGKACREKMEGQWFYAFIIDQQGSQSRQHTGMSIKQLYAQALAENNLISEATGSDFIFGTTDVKGRADLLRQHLMIRGTHGTPKLRYIREKCDRFAKEMMKYNRKRLATNDSIILDEPDPRGVHLPVCLEYWVGYNPVWHKPKLNPAYSPFNRYLEKLKKWKGNKHSPTVPGSKSYS